MSSQGAFGRTPTAAEIEVEQCVIGLLLEGSETAYEVVDRISAEDMAEPVHARVVQAAKRVLQVGNDITPVTLAAALASDKALNTLGGAEYFRGIQQRQGRNRHIAAELCKALIDHAQRRLMQHEIAQTESRLSDITMTAAAIAAEHQAAIQEISDGRPEPDEPISWFQSGNLVVEKACAPEQISRIQPFGLAPIDKEVGGMGPGDLCIVAGRPGMGKTAFSIVSGYAAASAKTQQQFDLDGNARPVVLAHPVGVFMINMEMRDDALLQRGLSMRVFQREGTIVPYKNIRLGRLNDQQKDWIADAAHADRDLPFVIDRRPGQTIGTLSVRVRRAQANFHRAGTPLGLVIIDHLGLIETGDQFSNRVAEITYITRSLKKLAASIDVPIMCLCQLNRGVESREDKRPGVSDLRDSGSIEQDADEIVLLYRPEYYLAKSKPGEDATAKKRDEWEREFNKWKGKILVHVAKNRHGAEHEATIECKLAVNWMGVP
jgi:replicative DNA helicase